MLYKLLCTYGSNKCAFEAVLPNYIYCLCLSWHFLFNGPPHFYSVFFFFENLVFQLIDLKIIVRRHIKCKIHDLV